MGTLTFSKADRAGIARIGRHLESFTVVWAGFEAAVALLTAFKTNNISLTGFGFDSFIEMLSGAALLWRLSQEMNENRRERAERISLQVAGACLIMLGGYVLIEASANLWVQRSSAISWAGILITAAALIFMPLLAQAKRTVGRALKSEAMMTDAKQADFCMYQAAIVLFGLLVDAIFHVGWADSVAALLLVPVLVRSGVLSLRGERCCAHHASDIN